MSHSNNYGITFGAGVQEKNIFGSGNTLNADLKKNPAILVDDKNLGDLKYTHCNGADGCVTKVVINNDVIELFKKGKTLTVFMAAYSRTKNMKIEFPLKNFSKSYAQLTKK